jgi:hypothetical protein
MSGVAVSRTAASGFSIHQADADLASRQISECLGEKLSSTSSNGLRHGLATNRVAPHVVKAEMRAAAAATAVGNETGPLLTMVIDLSPEYRQGKNLEYTCLHILLKRGGR